MSYEFKEWNKAHKNCMDHQKQIAKENVEKKQAEAELKNINDQLADLTKPTGTTSGLIGKLI